MPRLTNEEVAKAFGHFPSAHLRSHNGNLYANNGVIFSYGPHFPICQYVGNNEWLFTNRSYSVTTARHVSLVRRNLPRDATVWYVADVLAASDGAHLANVVNAIIRAEQAVVQADKSRRERTRRSHLDEANDLYAGAIKYCSRFLPGVWSLPAIDVYAPDVITVLNRLHAQRASAIEKHHACLNQGLEERIRRFREGENVRINSHVLLRLRDGMIETSTGYAIPLDGNRYDLAELLAKIMHARRTAKAINAPQIQLDGYTVNYISQYGDVEIGCQTIHWSEVEQLAFRLGWIDELEDDDPA